MKKIVSLLLIFLLLFNALGFYGLLIGLRYKSKLELVKRLDNEQYSSAETITLKIPISIPYQPDSKEYERVDGEVEHQGEYYRLIKQKFERDTLYLVCIKDQASKEIKQVLTDYVKTFTDKPLDTKQSGKTFISFIKDFLPTAFKMVSSTPNKSHSVAVTFTFLLFDTRSIPVFSPPPQS